MYETKVARMGKEVGISPTHSTVSNWWFKQEEQKLAALAHVLADIADDTGISGSELMHLFTPILRMMKVESEWSK